MYINILSNLAALSVAEGESNAGGIRRLRLIPADYVQTILPPDWYPRPEQADLGLLEINGQSIVILADSHFLDVDILPDYASYSEDSDSEANGEFYKPTIQLVIPKDRPAVTAWIHRYKSVRWIALLQDANGFNRLVGTPAQPLRMAVQNSLGAGKNGRNGRTLTFSCVSQTPAFYVNSLDDSDLFIQGEFSISFGFAYNS